MVKCQPLPTDQELTKDSQCNIYQHSALHWEGVVGWGPIQCKHKMKKSVKAAGSKIKGQKKRIW